MILAMSSQTYGFALGAFVVVAFVVGICSTAIKELILALADRVRYGKQPRPPELHSVQPRWKH